MKIKLDSFRKDDARKNIRGIFVNYRINYLIEFDLYIDITLIVFMFCAKIFQRLLLEGKGLVWFGLKVYQAL